MADDGSPPPADPGSGGDDTDAGTDTEKNPDADASAGVDAGTTGDADEPAAREEGQADAAAEDVAAYTTGVRGISARVQVQWALRFLVGLVVLAGVVRVSLSGLGVAVDPRAVPAGALVVGVLGLVWVHLRYRVWSYHLREDALSLERGVLTHVKTVAPHVRIQHVDTSRSPVERALGLSTLVVYTAGSRGADVSIPGLAPGEADDLQRRLKELAIESEGGDAL